MPASKAKHRANFDAVPGLAGFAALPRHVLKSEAYRTLSLMARAILIEIVDRMKGDNNGAIHISYAELAKRLNRRNEAPIGPAIAELMQHGLLDLGAEGIWKRRKAREYRLTWINTTDALGNEVAATYDYLRWTEEAKFDATDVVVGKRKSATTFVAGKPQSTTTLVVTDPAAPEERSTTDVVVLIDKPSQDIPTVPHRPVRFSPPPKRRQKVV